jgi:hypothetical protein
LGSGGTKVVMHVFWYAHASLKEAKQVVESGSEVAAAVTEMGLRGLGRSQ